MTTFLGAGVSLGKLNNFKELLKEDACRFTDRHNLSDLVCFSQTQEKKLIMAEINGRNITVIFKRTCHLGEALCLDVQYISDDWSIEQRLVALKMLQSILKGEETALEIISTLSIDYHVDPTSVLASMRDRAASNNVVLKTLKVLHPSLIHIWCFPDTIDHVGGKFLYACSF